MLKMISMCRGRTFSSSGTDHFSSASGKQRVIGVRQRLLRDLPRLLPRQTFFVQQNPHQLGDRQAGMRVVHLDGDLRGQHFDLLVLLAEAPEDIAQRAGDQEIFLHQPQLLAAHHRVGGIQYARDIFRLDLLLDGANVVAAVEDLDVEVFRSTRREQPQPVHGLAEIADDRHVCRYADHDLLRIPNLFQAVFHFARPVDLAVQRDVDRFFRMLDLEWSAVGLPAVRLLALEAVEDLLPEQAVFVIDAVSEAGHTERRQRLQKARRQPAQAAVAEASVILALQHLIQADAEAGQHFAAHVFDAQVRQVVAQRAAHQKFHREVVEPLGILVAIARFRLQHAIDNAIANRQGNGLEIVGGLQLGGRPHQRVADVTQYRFTQHFSGPDLRKKFRG